MLNEGLRSMETTEFLGTSSDIFGIDRVVFGFGRVAFENPGAPTKIFSRLSLGKSWPITVIACIAALSGILIALLLLCYL